MTMTPMELKSALEAIIYAADEPATLDQLAAAVGEEKHLVRAALDELVAGFGSDERGIEIRGVGGGYRFYTKPQHHDVVRRFIKSLQPPLRLTMPALETLAVIAYKQPVTQPELQEIRGVNCAGVLETLLARRLITTAGRKQVIGRPILYRTTRDFLMRFGLEDLDELPSLKEFEALAREALGADEGIATAGPDGAAQGAPDAVDGTSAESAEESAVAPDTEPTPEMTASGAAPAADLASSEPSPTEPSAMSSDEAVAAPEAEASAPLPPEVPNPAAAEPAPDPGVSEANPKTVSAESATEPTLPEREPSPETPGPSSKATSAGDSSESG